MTTEMTAPAQCQTLKSSSSSTV